MQKNDPFLFVNGTNPLCFAMQGSYNGYFNADWGYHYIQPAP